MNQTSDRADVVIIGGGVIGLAVARALALRGVRDVLLIERSSLGAEASSAAAGMLAPQAEANRAHEFFYLTCRSRDMYPAFAAALLEETGIDIELETTGTLYLAFTEHDERTRTALRVANASRTAVRKTQRRRRPGSSSLRFTKTCARRSSFRSTRRWKIDGCSARWPLRTNSSACAWKPERQLTSLKIERGRVMRR